MSVFSRAGLRALGCLSVILLSACATLPDNASQPVQSPNDDYAYRLLTLENGLQVLLVSDPDAPKAAASLTVMVGSGDNPPGRGGLAHFLEHMLFLGTDKYPDAAEYEEYITEHGGSRNAYTAFDHTNYFFDVNAPHLAEALDRFAQFFIAPRFDAQYVDREMNAVQAEYQMGLKSDGRRGLDVLQEVMNPEHPYSQFAVGSLETLADRAAEPIRDDLLDFYDKYYSANQMRLAVLGTQSLDELETLVVPMFGEVPNRDRQLTEFEAPIFEQDSLPMLVQIKPLATLRQLEVLFPVDDFRHQYRAKPLNYLGNLVGHEGEGSLLSQLKREGLAEGLAAGSQLAWRGGSLFGVGIDLTEKGVQQHERVLQLVFAYMDLLREQGPKQWLYDEQGSLADLAFRFREQGSAIGYVMGLSTGMHYYDAEDVLRGPYIMDEYDEQMLVELVAELRPQNALVIFNDQSAETDTVSEHYEVEYSTSDLDIAAVTLSPSDDVREAFALPEPNAFIAQDVSLEPLRDSAQLPSVALQAPRQTIWFMPDEEFRVPRGAIYINFRSAAAGQTAQQSALVALYTDLLMDSVNEFTYPARLAGLQFSVYKQAQGMSLKLQGYDDKQLVLLERLLEAIQTSEFDAQRFDDVRRDMIRSLNNTSAKRPSSQVMDDLREAVWAGRWGEQALVEVLETATPRSLAEYMKTFWRNASAEALVYGNYAPAVSEEVSDLLADVLPADTAADKPRLAVVKLQPGESLQYSVSLDHDDAVLAWYLQGADDSWRDRAASALTAQIMKSGFFQQLRTEQQLGYVVTAFNWPQHTVPGIVMLIQSPVADAEKLATAMDTFMRSVPAELDEAQFTRHKTALRSEILRPHKNLSERAEFYWQSIARDQLQFDAPTELVQALDTFTMDSWLDYYATTYLGERHSLQVVAPGRWDVLPEGTFERYESAVELKRDRAFYELNR